jgi:hypothetical protein
MREPIHYTRLLPGMEVTSPEVQRLVARLSTPESNRPLVFETWANDEGVMHLVGRTESGTPSIRTLLGTHLPGSRTIRGTRPATPDRVARLKLTPKAMPLREDATHDVLHGIHSVLAGRRKGECLAIQVVLGRGRRPAVVPPKILDPQTSFSQLLLRGAETAPTDTRRRIAQHAAQPRIDVTVRIGVSAVVPERRRQIRGQFLSALEHFEAPGTHLTLVSESPSRWDGATLGWSALPLTASQLTGLFGWPVDELDLPGLPPRHPKLLPPPTGVPTQEAVFARSTAPGTDTPIGMTPEARLLHTAVTGGTGSGKSEIFAHLALSDIRAGHPLVLIEPKRQLVDAIVARAPREAAGRIVVIDAAEPHPVGFNPLDIGKRDPGPVVDGILEVLKNVFIDGWGPRTEDLLLAGLLTLVANGRKRDRPHTLLDLPKLLSDDGYRRSVIGAVAGDPVLAAYWATFNELSPAHRANIVAAPLNKLRKYVLRGNVAAILGQSSPKFRLRDIFRGGKTAVLIPLNDALIGPGAAQLLGGLIVSEVWLATQERATESDPRTQPGFVFIDEVQRYLHLPTSIDDALATSRSYGVGWHLAFQGRGQVPAKLADAIELNARNQITFAASPKDAAALARTTTKLRADDFQALERFHIYCNLVADGAPAGWFSAKTEPPAAASGHADLIRATYREQFAGDGAPDTAAAASRPDGGSLDTGDLPEVRSHQRRRRS